MTRHPLKTTTNKIKTKYQIGSWYGWLLGYHLSLHKVQTNTVEALLRRTKLIAFVSSPNSQNSFRKVTALLTNSSHLKSQMLLLSHTCLRGKFFIKLLNKLGGHLTTITCTISATVLSSFQV